MTVHRAGGYAAAIFVSATLLFACQPMVARMIVPLLGGAPAVWIVCSLCFQTLLLAGYAYAHFTGTRFRVTTQVMLQLALVGAVFVVMPVTVDDAAAQRLIEGHPTIGLLLLLVRTIGLPFFVLSTTSPLLQRWFAELGARDPYYLYAASNAGSMLALLGYPFVIEPLLSVKAQSRALHAAFALYAVLVVVCAATTIRRRNAVRIETTPAPPAVRASESDSKIPVAKTPAARWRERLVWIGLAFAPSSLLLGVTEYVTTDLASIPLLWVIPLALYLASFIVAFGKKQVARMATFSRLFALAAVLVSGIMLARVERAPWVLVGVHMALLFLASVVCHRGLAERRPHVGRLTEFYLLMSVGGVLGGVFNGIIAPLVFDDLFEYPIAIGLVCLGRAALSSEKPSVRDALYGLGLGAVTYALVKIGAHYRVDPAGSFVWMFAPALLVAFAWAKRPVRYAIAVGAVLVAAMGHGGDAGETLFAKRNFFGVLKVTREHEGRFQLLVYGHTMYGKQARDEQGRHVPLAYYHPTGPAGDVLDPADQRVGRKVGVIGLGIGSLVAYADPGDEWTFFEINPTVVDVARRYFTYLSDAEQGAKVSLEIGDARLRLKQGPEARFDVVVLDALSSDAIPIHLITREALVIYRRALRPNGLILAHVTHDHLVLQPILAALAREARIPAIEKRDGENDEGKHASEWVVLGGSDAELARLRALGWTTLEAPAGQSVWTDDFANVLGAIRF
jgi:hypothetical protein